MQDKLDHKLYLHCRGVAAAAESLAARYGVNRKKAYLAGMIHDYGKRYSTGELLEAAGHYGVELDRLTKKTGKLLHAPVGAVLLENELGVKDRQILKAITYHTTGRPGMSGLEKVIYLADYIEAGRRFEGVDQLRSMAYDHLDRALLFAVDLAIRSVVKRGLILHPRSVAFRNSLILKLKNT